jgi:limonene-1,2-epoxide hydrolase
MVERVDNFEIAGRPFAMEVAAAFEVNDGRITRWHDYYDLRSIADRIAAG